MELLLIFILMIHISLFHLDINMVNGLIYLLNLNYQIIFLFMESLFLCILFLLFKKIHFG